METSTAEVIDVADGRARLRSESAAACPRCAAGKGCGAGLVAGSKQPREIVLALPPGLSLQPGDRVTLTLEPRQLLQATLYTYGLPLVAMAGVPAALNGLWGPLADLEQALASLLGLVAAVVLGRHFLRTSGCLGQWQPVINGIARHGA